MSGQAKNGDAPDRRRVLEARRKYSASVCGEFFLSGELPCVVFHSLTASYFPREQSPDDMEG
jgi:hypothetical protein